MVQSQHTKSNYSSDIYYKITECEDLGKYSYEEVVTKSEKC